MSNATDRPYQQRSSKTEDIERGDNDYEEPSNDNESQDRNDRPPPRREDQYIAALWHRFPNLPKTDYAYTQPIGPAVTPTPPGPIATQPTTTTTAAASTSTAAPQRNASYSSTSRPAAGGTITLDVADDKTFPRPALRPVNPEDKNRYARRLGGESTTPTSQVRTTTPGANVRINEGYNEANRPTTSRYPTEPNVPRTQESVFEKVPSHGGPVSYLGTGTFSQFEHCLHECLERERRHTGVASQITRHDVPPPISVNDYGYNSGIATSSHPVLHSTSTHYSTDYPSTSMGMFTIDDIRHINVALSRSGISLFPYERPFFHDSYSSPAPMPSVYPSGRHTTGEVVSACRVVEEDPALLYNRSGP